MENPTQKSDIKNNEKKIWGRTYAKYISEMYKFYTFS